MSQVAIDRLRTTFSLSTLGAISFCHFLNDLMQALLPAVYPILRGGFDLSFSQVGLLTLVYQLTASILQPLIGYCTDSTPRAWLLPSAMVATGTGLLVLGWAPNYSGLLIGAATLGLGSSIFHPESSRIARAYSGGSHGLAQSIFQVGGNFGSAVGPLAAAYLVLPRGQVGLAWFAALALGGAGILNAVTRRYRSDQHARRAPQRRGVAIAPNEHVWRAMIVLVALLFSKYVYLASITNYYMFYLMSRFHVSLKQAQIYEFVFFAAVAAGTVLGGPLGDRIGRKQVIWMSILGTLPFTMMLPYADLWETIVLSAVIGMVLASAFPAIVVFAQELVPGRTGLISGTFFGLAFGIGGISAAVLGTLADRWGISSVYTICSFLPALGLLTALLPRIKQPGQAAP